MGEIRMTDGGQRECSGLAYKDADGSVRLRFFGKGDDRRVLSFRLSQADALRLAVVLIDEPWRGTIEFGPCLAESGVTGG